MRLPFRLLLHLHFGKEGRSPKKAKLKKANQHEYLASGGACDAHVGHSFGPDTSRDWCFVSQMFS